MSEVDNQATAVLLPSSSVAVFSRDKDTLEAARDVVKDWRFARVTLHVDEGDVHSAIDAYKEIGSPDLIIIQTDKIDDSLPGLLEELANHCEEGTAAIVVGPDNDVDLYRKLIDMGVSDYLVRPIKTDFLADVIAKTLIDKIGVIGSRLIAFVGAKGGVGTSVLAQAMAWSVSDTLAQKTVFIDAAGGWSTAGVGMGFEPSTTLSEAAKAAADGAEDNLERMLHEASDKLSVLASGGDVMLEPTVTSDQIETLLDMLMVKYPVVIADLSHAPPELEKTIISRANQIVVVSTPTLPALRLSRSLIQEIKEVRGGDSENVEFIVNMQGMASGNEVAKKDIEEAMDLKVSSTISFDPKAFMGSESEGKKLTDHKDGQQIIKESLLPIAGKILAQDLPEDEAGDKGNLITGLLEKIKAK